MSWDPTDTATSNGPKRANDIDDGRLLAIDLGLRCGFAVYNADGDLLAYRSTHFPSVSTIRKASYKLLARWPRLTHIVVEGDREIGEIWHKLADKRGIHFQRVSPETWRAGLLTPTERSNTANAKAAARRIARDLIAHSPAPMPKSRMTHDVCEAILIGKWACGQH